MPSPPEGGFTVTSPVLSEMVNEGNSLDDALANAQDVPAAVVEICADEGPHLPAGVILPTTDEVVGSDGLLSGASCPATSSASPS